MLQYNIEMLSQWQLNTQNHVNYTVHIKFKIIAQYLTGL